MVERTKRGWERPLKASMLGTISSCNEPGVHPTNVTASIKDGSDGKSLFLIKQV